MIKRCVIKIGSKILVPENAVDEAYLVDLALQLRECISNGTQFVIVTSGAIAAGMSKLKLTTRPTTVAQKQAMAAIGQITLMETYQRSFIQENINVAQILVTHADFRNRKRFLNARHTILQLIELGVVPLINENDSVASEEIMVGDNDNLAGMVACLLEADLLILLSDIEGLYTADPKSDPDATLISNVSQLDREIEAFAAPTTNTSGVGGMKTKIEAASRAGGYDIPTVIAHGHEKNVISKIMSGKAVGTRIELEKSTRLQARKHWIRHVLKPEGQLILDAGAVNAIQAHGRSLLPSGIIEIKDSFDVGDSVELVDKTGTVIAHGLVSYSSGEIDKIKGAQSESIEEILGYRYRDEVIHRNDLVLLG